jgi:hypothetical protein
MSFEFAPSGGIYMQLERGNHSEPQTHPTKQLV